MNRFIGTTSRLAALLLLMLALPYSSNLLSDTYDISPRNNINNVEVYRSIDGDGRVTYSSMVPEDVVEVEQLALPAPPDRRSIDERQSRQREMRQAAQQLAEARERREQQRLDEEQQRLERLALWNRSRPPLRMEHNLYIGHPYRPWRYGSRQGPDYGRHPVNLPARDYPSSRLPLPPSSFPNLFRSP